MHTQPTLCLPQKLTLFSLTAPVLHSLLGHPSITIYVHPDFDEQLLTKCCHPTVTKTLM